VTRLFPENAGFALTLENGTFFAQLLEFWRLPLVHYLLHSLVAKVIKNNFDLKFGYSSK
jgi:hypothetical protein